MPFLRKVILILLQLASMTSLWGQVTFQAKAPTSVDLNGQFRLQFVISNAEGTDFQAPDLTDFDILSGPSISSYSSTQIANGSYSSTRSTTYTFILAPKRKGTISIGTASIRVEGRTLRSNALKITITPGVRSTPSTQQNSDQNPFATIQRSGNKVTESDLYFTVDASHRKVYEQEPILLTYKLHARAGIGLSNVMLRQKPDLKGFWTQEIELPRNLAPTTARESNRLYRVATNLQYIIFPQQTGKITIPSITFDCDILQQDESIDEIDAFFNGVGQISLRAQRRTPDLTIEVLPLPHPRPTNFSGGVGSFQVKGSLYRSSLPKTNDIATYRFTIQGQGNLKLVKAPKLFFPKDFDTFDPKMVDETHVGTDGVTGSVHFDYNFVPRHVGTYTLPSVEFVYFDTHAHQYRTLRTQPLTLNIAKGERSAADVETELALRSSDIRPIHTGALHIFSPSGLLWWGSLPHLLILTFLLAVSIWGAHFAKKLRINHADHQKHRVKRAAAHAHEQLRHAERALKDAHPQNFYNALSQAFTGYLADKLDLTATALTHSDILRSLKERGVAPELCHEVEQLLDEIDLGRFSPSNDTTIREEILHTADRLLHALEPLLK